MRITVTAADAIGQLADVRVSRGLPQPNSEFLAILPCRIVDDLIVWVFVSNISVRISVILTILLFSFTLHGLVQSIVHLYQVHGSSSCQVC
jgi:hypothetical protein